MTLAWLIGYSFAVGRARRTLERSALRRALEGALGVTLIALGLRVATQRR
jgi:threonine/homoserine/homoserine lactone efflux protein